MTDPTVDHTVSVDDVSYVYPDGTRALEGIDFRVAAGERVAILGPNGSGKSTLVLHLNGILQPTTGAVAIDGVTIDEGSLREIRRRVGVVFQDPDDQLFMPTVEQDVAFGPANLGFAGDELATRVHDALDAVGMADHGGRPPHHLSLGQRRRVALATVLSMQPSVLVFDEPSANLDPMARHELAVAVERLGLTTLIVTHDLAYAAQLCDRALLLDHGRLGRRRADSRRTRRRRSSDRAPPDRPPHRDTRGS